MNVAPRLYRTGLLLVLLLTATTLARAQLSGTRTIPGDYATITAAVADIQAKGLNGALLLELGANYTGTGDTSLTIPSLNGASATNTVTIRPASGATGLVITGSGSNTTRLDGANFVTIDGRPGGTGSAKELTLANTSPGEMVVRFINEASNNTIRYVTLRGVANSAANGVVYFQTTTGANGNDNNTIDHCDIRDGNSMPVNGIYSSGSTGTAAQNNSGNTISNCNIFNFSGTGVLLAGGSTDWTITGNSFYQTATRPAVSATVRAIYINNTSGNNFTVTNNFIGGSEASAGGTAWTTTGTAAAYLFAGIHLNVGTTTPSSVQGNTIRNFVWTSSSNASSASGVWSGIYLQAGSANIGTTTGNTIGSSTGTDSVSVTTSTTGGTAFGIGSSSSGTVAISNNAIGSITTNGSGSTIGTSIVGIQVVAGTNTISGNTIGSTTTANSLNAATAITGVATQNVSGIITVTSSASANIAGNTIANLNNNCAGTFGAVRGISTSAGVNNITGNTVRNLSNAAGTTNATTGQSVYGIVQTSTTAGQTVSQNVVHSLSNTAATATVSITGIYFAGPTSGTNTIARNLVHSLSTSSTGSFPITNGMMFAAGTFTAQNNMVRVGVGASGTSSAGGAIVRGIYDNGTTAGRNFYHNSIYLGGTSSNPSSTALESTGTTNARTFQNNIVVNARTNGAGTGKHWAVIYSGTGVNPTGLTTNSNIFYVSGTGGVLGSYNGDRTTLADWQTATGQDAASAFVDPKFKTPAGDSSTVDLHLQASNPAESGGVLIASVTDDFDGETRSAFTPVDIGADAGNFTSSSGDIYAPVIAFNALSDGSSANRTLTAVLTVTDNSGTVAGGASVPRLYFKKSTDADVFNVPNNAIGNGWKYVVASNGASPYSFTIDYSILNGGGVAVGDTIQYFFVAQDTANNLSSNPAGATASANPPVQNINGHGGVYSYTIRAALSGTKTVGSGGNYASLTQANGLFAAINASVVTGNLIVNITGDLTEDGANALNQWTEEGAGNYTLTIQSDAATMRTISGTAAAGMIRLNGADRVTIDGRFGGAGRFLTFRNSSTINPTIYLFNDASGNTIRSSVIEGASTGNGVIILTTGATTGNDDNTITDNQVRNLSTAAGVPFSLIVSQGSSTTIANSNNTVSNNEMFNFTNAGVQINGGSESFTISGNTIYQTAARTTPLYGIDFSGSGTNQISGNTIRDLNTSAAAYGIRLTSASSTTISRNRIYSFPSASGSTFAQIGIFANQGSGSTATIVNNQISIAPLFMNAQLIYGIDDANNAGATTNIYYNTVLVGGTASGTTSTWAFLRFLGSTATLRDNIFFNNRTGGTGNHFAAGNQTTGGTFSSNYNLFVGTGATAPNFFDFGTDSAGTPVSFAQWQTSTGGDANSSAGNPGGNFTSAMFVDPTAGNLHIVAGGNPLVSNTGTPVAGLITDFDGDTRSSTTPDLGSDEFGISNNADLSNLALNSGTLSPFFSSSTLSYTATVGNTTTSVLVTPTKADPNATVTINGGSPAMPVVLNVGANTITVVVTAQDTTTTKTYTIVVTRRSVFEDWALANGVAADPNATDANGQKRLVNFAFGISPSTSFGLVSYNGNVITPGSPSVLIINQQFGVDYRALYSRRKDYVAAGLSYVVQFSADLSTWVDSTATPIVMAENGVLEAVTVPYPLSINGRKPQFFRVAVTQQ